MKASVARFDQQRLSATERRREIIKAHKKVQPVGGGMPTRQYLRSTWNDFAVTSQMSLMR
jgi:hypothetical protein